MSRDIRKFLIIALSIIGFITVYTAVFYYADKSATIDMFRSAFSLDIGKFSKYLKQSPQIIYDSLIAPDINSELDYPTVYSDANLPQNEFAKLVEVIPETPDALEGLRLKFITESTYGEVVEYYDGELEKLGWTLPNTQYADSGLLTRIYTKENLEISLTGTNIGTQEKVYSLHVDEM